MAYNITKWKTKKLSDLKIPIWALYDDEVDIGWRPQGIYVDEYGDVVVACGGSIQLKGRLDVDPETGRKIIAAINDSKSMGLLVSGKLGVLIDPQAIAKYDLAVTEIKCSGECSGGFWNECLKKVLAKSTGFISAVRIWEGGDSIDQLLVKDGEIIEEPYEL